ncbi:hypothetical protein HDU98_000355 [Podochytrium sp. JEL0797]|nr:hypothetical protein HDU98_000355 [Podochytrium sp. JEL0797]
MSLIASREDIAHGLKHLAPSGKDWVGLVTRAVLKQKDKDTKAAQKEPVVAGSSDHEDKGDSEDANDEEMDDFDDVVKFVFEQGAANPWDERLYKWVMGAFDGHSAFLTDDSSTPIGEASIRPLIMQTPDWKDPAALLAAITLESGGRVAIVDSVDHRDSLKKAVRSVSATPVHPPKMNNAQLTLELSSISSAIDKERERFSLRVKDICDPYLNLSVKCMNALYDFDDAITDRFLNEEIGKLVKKKVEQSKMITSFDAYWTEATKSFAAPVKQVKGKKGGEPASASTVNANDVHLVDSLWEAYLDNMQSAFNLCIDTISSETISQIVVSAQQLQQMLVQSLDEMIQQSNKTPITTDIQELIDGTKENLFHFKTFLTTESNLHRTANQASLDSLHATLTELRALYNTTSANVTPTIRGRLERTRSKEFVKKMKQFETEQSQFRHKLIANLEEFAENIQWDGLVLGVEVVGACLEICNDDLEEAHVAVQQDWDMQVRDGVLFDKLELMTELYQEGIRFGMFEYVKAVGKPLVEAMEKRGDVAPASVGKKAAGVSAIITQGTEVPSKKKKSKKGKKKGVKTLAEEEADVAEESEDAAVVVEGVAAEPPTVAVPEAETEMELVESDDGDEDYLDSAIPPQYHTPTITTPNESLPIPTGSPVVSNHSVSPKPAASTTTKPTTWPSVPEWPKKAPTSTPPAANATTAAAAVTAAAAPPGLASNSVTPPQLAMIPPNLPAPLPVHQPTMEEFQLLRASYARALHDMHQLRNDAGMFLQEIHRLNGEVVHWKGVAEKLQHQAQAGPQQQQQQQQSPFFQNQSGFMKRNSTEFGSTGGGPPGLVAAGATVAVSAVSVGAGNTGGSMMLGSLSSQIKPPAVNVPSQSSTAATAAHGSKDAGKSTGKTTPVRSKSPVSWRRAGGGQEGAVFGGRGMGAIGGEKRMARPPGLLSSPKDPNSVRRAFLKGARELRCGNCGEAGHDSSSCNAACRYCDQVGHLAAQCPF